MNRDLALKQAQELSNNNRWLLEHIFTSFWHTFGISNGLRIPRDKVRLGNDRTYKDGCIEIPAEVMRDLLAQWQSWLDSYAKVWNTDAYEDTSEGLFTPELNSCHQSWNRVRDALLTVQIGIGKEKEDEHD